MITGIEHIAIFAKDTKALADFYVSAFGFEIVYDNKKGTYFVAAPDKSLIEICVALGDAKPTDLKEWGIRHIALSADDIENTAKRLIDLGVEVISPVNISENGIGTFFFRDIEGNVVHLIQRPTPLV